jgi:hypothetical protein
MAARAGQREARAALGCEGGEAAGCWIVWSPICLSIGYSSCPLGGP